MRLRDWRVGQPPNPIYSESLSTLYYDMHTKCTPVQGTSTSTLNSRPNWRRPVDGRTATTSENQLDTEGLCKGWNLYRILV